MPVNTHITNLQPEGLSVPEACRVSGLGRTKIYEAIAAGRLKARKFGKRTIILRLDLQQFLVALPVIQ
jgi:excisionase family DNA binding protein